MLTRIVSKKAVLVVEQAERRGYGLTFAARSDANTFQPYDLWRFRTYMEDLRASYYERWTPTDATKRRYALERGYLHVFQRFGSGRDADERQIFALHCDPNETNGEVHARYKRGPHIHVSAAGWPLKDAHIALNFSHLEEILSSLEQLSVAWSNAITLVAEQVLDLHKKTRSL